MVLEKEQIKIILGSSVAIKNFMDFLSLQEVEIISDICVDALNNLPDGQNYDQWSKTAQAAISNQLVANEDFFGLKDLQKLFPSEEFLQSYYKAAKGD